jgi:hypothetical protein
MMVAHNDFECAYSGVGFTHVCMSFHVWEILNSKAHFWGKCNDAKLDQCSSLLTWTFDHKHIKNIQSIACNQFN